MGLNKFNEARLGRPAAMLQRIALSDATPSNIRRRLGRR